jgi:hypothetical protein
MVVVELVPPDVAGRAFLSGGTEEIVPIFEGVEGDVEGTIALITPGASGTTVSGTVCDALIETRSE